MVNQIDTDALPPAHQRSSTVAWAIGASLVLHILGLLSFNVLQQDAVVADAKYSPNGDSALMQATLLPLRAVTVPKPSPSPSPSPNPSPSPSPSPNPNPKVSPTSAEANSNPPPEPKPKVSAEPPAPVAVKTDPVPAIAAKPIDDTAPPPAPSQSAPPPPPPLEPNLQVADVKPPIVSPTTQAPPIAPTTLPPTTQLVAQVDIQPASQLPTTMVPNSYRLPNQATVRYEATVMGFSGQSILTWKKISDTHQLRYEAQMSSSATVFFKTIEHRYKAAGLINSIGLAPLAIEEKRTSGSIIATTIEPENNRTIISNKEGFLPYDPLGKDLISLIVQLGINIQSQPQWNIAGTAQDYTVYRPSGIKRWRFQSMGLETVQINNQAVQTVYIKRVPLGADRDFEDQHHFWLDPQRYGFPVKLRFVDSKGLSTDIVMADWQEQ